MKKQTITLIILLLISSTYSYAAYYMGCSHGVAYVYSDSYDSNGNYLGGTYVGTAGGCAGGPWYIQLDDDYVYGNGGNSGGGNGNSDPDILEATPEMYMSLQEFSPLTNDERIELTCEEKESLKELNKKINEGSIEKRYIDLDLVHPSIARLFKKSHHHKKLKWLKITPNPIINNELHFRFRSDKKRTVSVKVLDQQQNELFNETYEAQIGDNEVIKTLPLSIHGLKVLKVESEGEGITKKIIVQ